MSRSGAIAPEVTRNLPAQLQEVLRNKSMSLSQLSTYYAIKYKFSLSERLSEAKLGSLSEYLEQLSATFEVKGDTVRVRPKAPKPAAEPESTKTPAATPLTTIRYAHISRALQKLLNEHATGRMKIVEVEAAFQTSFGVSIGSVIGMPTVEYLERKANVFTVDGCSVSLHPDFRRPVDNETKEKEKDKHSPADNEAVVEKPAVGECRHPVQSTAPRGSPSKLPTVWESRNPVLSKAPWNAASKTRSPEKESLPSSGRSASDVSKEAKKTATETAERRGPKVVPPRAPIDTSSGSTPSSPVLSAANAPSSASTTAPSSPVPSSASSCKEGATSRSEGERPTQGKEGLPHFAIDELVRIFEEHSEGPIMHSSVLCSLFMQRHGSSVTDVSGRKPMELFRQHPESFLWLSSGNVALTKSRGDRAVQHELKLLDEQPKSVRVRAAAAEAAMPVPENVSEQDVIDYMIGLLHENAERDSIYISALCGRFMQRFRRPVTEVVGCKPTDFLKRHSDKFYLEKGGHVKLVSPTQPPQSSSDTKVSDAQTVAKPTVQRWADAEQENTEVDEALATRVNLFCAKLKEGLFFKVAEVAADHSGSMDPTVEIPIRVTVSNLPTELYGTWMPQMLSGIRQVMELMFIEEVSEVALDEEKGVRCRLLGEPDVKLLVRVELVSA